MMLGPQRPSTAQDRPLDPSNANILSRPLPSPLRGRGREKTKNPSTKGAGETKIPLTDSEQAASIDPASSLPLNAQSTSQPLDSDVPLSRPPGGSRQFVSIRTRFRSILKRNHACGLRPVGWRIQSSALLLLLAGCGGIGVAKEQLLDTPPSIYQLEATPDRVWHSVRAESIERPGHRMLVDDSSQRLLSWFEDASTWSALAVEGSASDQELYAQILDDIGNDGVALTTVQILGEGEPSRMRVRRVYYGSGTQPYIGQARGRFATALADRVRQRLSRTEERQ